MDTFLLHIMLYVSSGQCNVCFNKDLIACHRVAGLSLVGLGLDEDPCRICRSAFPLTPQLCSPLVQLEALGQTMVSENPPTPSSALFAHCAAFAK